MSPRKVLLVGWDAADWKIINPLLDAGEMPNVRRLVENGAMGQIATLHPPLSPMLWTSVATGKRPFKHGILGFTEPAPDGRGVQPVTNLSRKSKAVWNILNQSGLHSVVVGWWPSHPAEPIDGVMVSDHYHRAFQPLEKGWPLVANAVHPPELAQTLAGLRVHPDSLTPEMVERFIPLARDIDQENDKRLGGLMKTLAECMSIQSAASWLIENRPWDFFAVYFDAIDHFCHAFMKYHPPRQSWIPERDFELYGKVVGEAYRFHDEMLGTLLAKAGEGITVILMSDHGFHPDHLRPSAIPDIPAGPAIEHRQFGVFAISGRGIKRDELLHGASLLDIAPTVLTLYGLPVGEDMDGKPLTQAFVEAPPIARVPSWENVPGEDGRHPSHTRLDPAAAREAMEQMVALGYIAPPAGSAGAAVANTIKELRYNLGEAYQDAQRHHEARDIFAELYREDPDRQRFAVRYFVSCQALGLTDEMRRVVDEIAERPQVPRVIVDYLRAQVLTAEKRYPEALESLSRVSAAPSARPGLLLESGNLLVRLGRFDEAGSMFRKVLDLDPDNAPAYVGLSRVALRRSRFDEAARAALNALQRVYHLPVAHYLLGMALSGMNEHERAAVALRAAISFNPNFPEAHERLTAILQEHLGDAEAARRHRELAGEMRAAPGILPYPQGSEPVPNLPESANEPAAGDMPPLSECLIVVSGLPRSGTSMLMQMLQAGGLAVVTDRLRQPDEDNPNGYLEFEPVKNLLKDSSWLSAERGKAIKIVAPLLSALPPGLPCYVVICQRDLDEVLDSQERMLGRRGQNLPGTPERRSLLKTEYGRTMARVKTAMGRRPLTRLLIVEHANVIANPGVVAARINEFLGGGLNTEKMAAAVDPSLHRNKARS